MNLKPRTCPHCGYKYGVKNYFKLLFFKPIWKKWECHGCGTEIKFSVPHRIMIALFETLVLFALFVYKDTANYGFLFIIAIVLITFPLLFLLDTLKETKKLH